MSAQEFGIKARTSLLVRSGVENLWKVGARFPTVALWIALLASSLGTARRAKAELLGGSPPPAPNSGVTAQDWRRAKGAVSTCGALLWAVTPGCRPCWGLGQERSGVNLTIRRLRRDVLRAISLLGLFVVVYQAKRGR